MSESKIPMARVELSTSEIEAAVSVLRSGGLRQGQKCLEFERAFAAAVGTEHAVVVSSGTAALHLAWMALIQPGDEVLVPSFTFIASASSVVLAGGRPVFCDVEPATGNLDVADARRRVTSKTRGVAPVHLFGHAADVDGIRELGDEFGLRIVWDCAQAHGTLFRGRDVGSFEDVSCYSLYSTKNMTTGEGGMITTDDGDLAARLRLLRSHGQAGKYHHTLIGLNYRMTDIQAAIGTLQLVALPRGNAARQANAERLDTLLSGLPGIQIPSVDPDVVHSYHQYTIQVDPELAGIDRDELQVRLAEAGVESAVHYPKPLHQQPVFNVAVDSDLPVSERLARQVLSLPVHPLLEASALDRIGAAVQDAVVVSVAQ
ncbi:MAG TPA: DegT/DnrJ/EryC1/StrS family aminotransferase [Candidatus Dormibacteraeota bacterium]|jgi:perosamine synthetase|nr:DegT/DnrJ/EryC1/StrS family aminotransferase [Candidatus Dormibacteraeota bacterium]